MAPAKKANITRQPVHFKQFNNRYIIQCQTNLTGLVLELENMITRLTVFKLTQRQLVIVFVARIPSLIIAV